MAATEKRPEIIELSRDLRGVPQCEEYECMISGMMYAKSLAPSIPTPMKHQC